MAMAASDVVFHVEDRASDAMVRRGRNQIRENHTTYNDVSLCGPLVWFDTILASTQTPLPRNSSPLWARSSRNRLDSSLASAGFTSTLPRHFCQLCQCCHLMLLCRLLLYRELVLLFLGHVSLLLCLVVRFSATIAMDTGVVGPTI